MLAISHDAAQAIKQVVSSAQMSDEGGIRISGEPVGDDSMRIGLALATNPEPGDAIVAQEGVHVFVDQTVAPLLDDKTLDAGVQADQVTFAIVDQQQDWSSDGRPEDVDPRNIG